MDVLSWIILAAGLVLGGLISAVLARNFVAFFIGVFTALWWVGIFKLALVIVGWLFIPAVGLVGGQRGLDVFASEWFQTALEVLNVGLGALVGGVIGGRLQQIAAAHRRIRSRLK